MSNISISTSNYTKQIPAEIDGVPFKVTPMSSSQAIAYLNLCDDLDVTAKNGNDAEKTKNIIEKLDEVLFSVFDQPDKAREVLAKVPIEGVIEIYQKIVAGAQNG